MRGSDALVDDLMGTLANRAVDRSLGDRRTQYAEEIQRVLEATYDLIEQTGNVDPSLRDILAASNLSTQAFYRYFQSKDELFLLLLDDGRRRLVGSLERRMNKATTAADRVRAWIEGVLAQASDTRAAGRTRPFLTDQDRLAEAFPREQQASVDLLVDLRAARLREPTRRCRGRLPHGVRDAARSPDPRHPAYRRRDRTSRALLPRRDRRRSTRGRTT
jgi:AcrR family transcriptional regulator